MIASRQEEIIFHRGIGRQCGRGFVALAQVIGKTAIPFVRKYDFPDSKRVGADFLDFAAPKYSEVVSCREKFKTAAKNVGRETLRKLLGSGSRKTTASRVIPPKSEKGISRSRRDNLQTFLINHVQYQLFVAVSGNLRGKVPVFDNALSSHEYNRFILIPHSMKIA